MDSKMEGGKVLLKVIRGGESMRGVQHCVLIQCRVKHDLV